MHAVRASYRPDAALGVMVDEAVGSVQPPSNLRSSMMLLLKSRIWTLALLCAAFLAAPCWGDGQSPQESAPADSTVQQNLLTAERIDALIKQLDDANFNKRQAASVQLARGGRQVAEALEKAAQGDSREVTTRSIDVLKKLMESDDGETKAAAKAAMENLAKCDKPAAAKRAQEILNPKPEPAPEQPFPGGGIRIGGGQIQLQMNVQAIGGKGVKRVTIKQVNGVKDIDVAEGDRKIKIHDDPNQGIKVQITEKKDGKEETSKYEAKDADELKKKHPEAHKIYEEYTKKNAGGAIQIQGIQIGPGGGIQIKPGKVPAIPLPPQIQAVPKQPVEKPKAAAKIEKATKELQEITELLKKRADGGEELQKAVERLEELTRQLKETMDGLDE